MSIMYVVANFAIMDLPYKEFEKEGNRAQFEIPDWQVILGKEELQHIANGNAGLLSWDEAQTQFEL